MSTDDLDIVLALVGATLLVLGVLSRVVDRLWLSPVLLAVAVGVLSGPQLLDVMPADVAGSRPLLEEVARLTLAVALVGAGLQLTRDDLRQTARPAGLLLTGGMVGMWIVTSLGAWLLLDLPFWAAFLLGAILTPTDPVVASTLVTSPLAKGLLPRRVRSTLQLESATNDGLALPFVLLAALMLTEGSSALSTWAGEALLAVGVGIAVGGVLGYAAARLVEFAQAREESESNALFGTGLALAVFVLGLAHVLEGSGVLGAFAAGLAFSLPLKRDVRQQLEEVQESVVRFFVLPVFVLFGASLPFSGWVDLGWAGPLLALWVLVLRRPPIGALVLRFAGVPGRSVAFLSWFGPVGVAALFYATFVEKYAFPEYETVWAAATLAICASIAAHTLTATPAVLRHAGRPATETLRRPLDPEAGAKDAPS